MTPAIAATAAASISASAALFAQDAVAGEATWPSASVLAFGAGVIAWLVRREAVDRKAAEERVHADLEHRRAVDIRRDAENDALKEELTSWQNSTIQLYERMVELAHRADAPVPSIDVPE